MGYRRAHHRQAHTRTNSDGSKSYVRESDVKGHNYERDTSYSYSSSSGDCLDELLSLISLSGFILLILGAILKWEETLWYLAVILVPLLLLYLRNK